MGDYSRTQNSRDDQDKGYIYGKNIQIKNKYSVTFEIKILDMKNMS
jgi:hypothetical protein